MSDAATEAVAGALGSIVSLLSTYPLKTIYTLQAIKAKKKLSAKDPQSFHHDSSSDQSDASSNIFSSLPVLFAGIQPAVVETALSQGIYFYLYSLQKNFLLDVKRNRFQGQGGSVRKHVSMSVAESLLVASLAGAGNMLITSPAQVIATRQQADHSEAHRTGREKKTTWQTAVSIFEEDGLGGFWKGVLPNLMLVVNPAIQYMLFEALMTRRKRQHAKKGAKGPLGAGEVFMIGALAKLGATIVTYPMIVVKSRLQAAGKAKEGEGGTQQYTGTLDVITRMLKEEGVGGFYNGINAKMLQTVLNAAIMLMLKEKLQQTASRIVKARKNLLVQA